MTEPFYQCELRSPYPCVLDYAVWMLQQNYLSISGESYVWRKAIITHGTWKLIEPRRAENVGGKGYLRLSLQLDGRLQSVMAHRFIWRCLRGEIPESLQINHKDLNKQNNHLSNLELVTQEENMAHSYSSGNRVKPWSYANVWRGKKRLTEDDKQEIRKLRYCGFSYKEISQATQVSMTHIQRICSVEGGAWKNA